MTLGIAGLLGVRRLLVGTGNEILGVIGVVPDVYISATSEYFGHKSSPW